MNETWMNALGWLQHTLNNNINWTELYSVVSTPLTQYSCWRLNPWLCTLLLWSCSCIGSFWWNPTNHWWIWREGSLAYPQGILESCLNMQQIVYNHECTITWNWDKFWGLGFISFYSFPKGNWQHIKSIICLKNMFFKQTLNINNFKSSIHNDGSAV